MGEVGERVYLLSYVNVQTGHKRGCAIASSLGRVKAWKAICEESAEASGDGDRLTFKIDSYPLDDAPPVVKKRTKCDPADDEGEDDGAV